MALYLRISSHYDPSPPAAAGRTRSVYGAAVGIERQGGHGNDSGPIRTVGQLGEVGRGQRSTSGNNLTQCLLPLSGVFVVAGQQQCKAGGAVLTQQCECAQAPHSCLTLAMT
ncbi:hypothetical protein [Aeromonas veronii]|uniref:hypothetical protein n=1 Tax=Aeromonas veronii TaxID=654 RepID=UPI001E3D47E1|nr:hypothetical protein [Aeromonas veronii]MCD6616741.1 hypothetical protein [Aeromonas veronii]